jgi:hypothetical protein
MQYHVSTKLYLLSKRWTPNAWNPPALRCPLPNVYLSM